MKFLVLVLLAAAVAAEQKREAEPHYGYAGYYGLPYRAYGYGYGVPGGYVRVHSVGKREADPEAEPHYSSVHANGISKREAEAEPEPHIRGYGLGLYRPYGFSLYRPFSYGYYRPFGYGYYW
ncbi:uncharacterized protein LOC119573821 [Penaeus monodon]|uniref:uncharacterized protein LOC119573821 n=1 Tax=Penaeus monodon TaxID=6687 RepID=UPI0018A72480|nr:uncharacterized protein LOC119573821 [Penaeus monodon]